MQLLQTFANIAQIVAVVLAGVALYVQLGGRPEASAPSPAILDSRWFLIALLAFIGISLVVWVLRLGIWLRVRSKGLVVHSAYYGPGDGRYKDVTVIVRGYIQSGHLEMAVTNLNLKGDPFPHEAKHLKVVYSFNGRRNEIVRHENCVLTVPEAPLESRKDGLFPPTVSQAQPEPALFVGRVVPILDRLGDSGYFDLNVILFNGTGREIDIEQALKGAVICNDRPQEIPAAMPDPPSRQDGRRRVVFSIRQYLSPDFAAQLRDDVESGGTLTLAFEKLEIGAQLTGAGADAVRIRVPMPDGITIKKGLMVGELMVARIPPASLSLSGALS